MNELSLFNGFILGLLGSLHCLGMCGPLVISLPQNDHSILHPMVENLFRIVTYTVLGLIMGVFGKVLMFHEAQTQVSLMIGFSILIIFLLPQKIRLKIQQVFGVHYLNQYVMKLWTPFLKKKSLSSVVVIGLLHGFLPCGLVTIALVSAATLHDPVNSSFFMMSFGLGTIPALLGTVLLKRKLLQKVRIGSGVLVKFGVLSFASLLILRGLALDIPYISPSFDESGVQCCGNK